MSTLFRKDLWPRPAHILDQTCIINHHCLLRRAIRKPLKIWYRRITLMMTSKTMIHRREPTTSAPYRTKYSNNRRKLFTLKTTFRQTIWISERTSAPAIAIQTTMINKSKNNLWVPLKFRQTIICCSIMTVRWELTVILGIALMYSPGPQAPIMGSSNLHPSKVLIKTRMATKDKFRQRGLSVLQI